MLLDRMTLGSGLRGSDLCGLDATRCAISCTDEKKPMEPEVLPAPSCALMARDIDHEQLI